MSHHGKTKAQKGSLPAMTVTPVAAAIGVVLRDDQVLLVRRANQPDAGKWGFPGGKIEPGEPVQAAAAREVVEETLEYVLRELALPDGGLASAQDADTDGVEGLTHTWTLE